MTPKMLQELMKQMAQPEWKENDTGHIVVDKQPKTQEGVSTRLPSPDLWDALVMSLSADFDDNKGLTTRR